VSDVEGLALYVGDTKTSGFDTDDYYEDYHCGQGAMMLSKYMGK